MQLKFPYLTAGDIECRVAKCTKDGVSILLYKDARVDQRILDETVGPMNWQRHHSRDNANCIVSIWDSEKQQWIEKEDTGTESNTEAAKGLASDSFKRACFNWGIGRELYTAPFIWIKKDKCNIDTGRNGNPACYDRFKVSEIHIKDGVITSLVIINKGFGCVFTYGNPDRDTDREGDEERAQYEATATDEQKNQQMAAEASTSLIDAPKIAAIQTTIKRKGLSNNSILQHYKRTAFAEMTLAEWSDAMNLLQKYKDKN